MSQALPRLRRRLAGFTRRMASDPYLLVLLGLAILYVIVFTGMAWDFHAGMRTHKADLGQIDQAIWNSSRGRFLQQTDNGFVATRLTDHVEPLLVLISPVYWLWNDVRAILLLQAIAAAIGVLPLYALACRLFERLLTAQERGQIWRVEPLHQLTRPLAFALGVAYLLAPQLQSAVLTEFHAAPLAAPLILWAFWSVEARRWGQFVVAALLTALVKEEIALLAAGLGVWAVWRAFWESRQAPAAQPSTTQPSMAQRERWLPYLAGAGVLVLALLWFYLATFVIVPANAAPLYGAGESTYFRRYGALGDTSADIVKSFFTQPRVVWQIATEPARVGYLAGLVAAFALLPVLGFDVLVLSLPVLLANLLSAYPAQYYGEFHYSAPLVPYFAVAAAYGLARLWRWLWRWTERRSAGFQHLPAANGGVMAAASLVQNAATAVRPLLSVALVVWILAWSGGYYLLHGRGPLGGRYDPTPITAHDRLLQHFTAQLPADAAVTATAAVHPHVSHRQYMYQFPLGLDAPVPAEWALLDVTTNTDMAPGDLKRKVDEMLGGGWGVVDGADGLLLLRKGAASKGIPEAFYSFARISQGAPATEPLRLTNLSADDWARWRQTKLVAEWQVGQGYRPQGQGPALEIVTPGGDTLPTLGTAAPPALVWYPPDRWQPGDTVRITTLPLTLPRVFGVRTPGGDPAQPAIFVRGGDGRLRELAAPGADTDLGAMLGPALGGLRPSQEVQMTLPDGRKLSLQGWLPEQGVAPGQPVNVWLRWQFAGKAEWPPTLAAFVHLRHDGKTIAQQDGPPRWFGRASAPLGEGGAVLADWRQIPLSADASPGGEWTVVAGVYDTQTGQRLPLSDGQGKALGDELVLGQVRVEQTPVADQACALNAENCR